jgi:hypothetical protein
MSTNAAFFEVELGRIQDHLRSKNISGCDAVLDLFHEVQIYDNNERVAMMVAEDPPISSDIYATADGGLCSLVTSNLDQYLIPFTPGDSMRVHNPFVLAPTLSGDSKWSEFDNQHLPCFSTASCFGRGRQSMIPVDMWAYLRNSGYSRDEAPSMVLNVVDRQTKRSR